MERHNVNPILGQPANLGSSTMTTLTPMTAISRTASPPEMAAYDRFMAALREGTPKIQALRAAAALLAETETWRAQAVADGLFSGGFLPPLYTPARAAQDAETIRRWNRAAEAARLLAQQAIGFRLRPDGDLDIVALPGANIPPLEMQTLGVAPIVILAAASTLITAAIAYTTSVYLEGEQDARNLSRELTKIDQRMAAAPEPVRRAYAQLQSSERYTGAKSLVERITGSLSAGADKAALLGLIALGGFALWKLAPERPRRNPRRQRRRANANPCDKARGGYGTPPDQWRVNWSTDPARLDAQIDGMLARLPVFVTRKWKSYFDAMRAAAEAGGTLEPWDYQPGGEY